MIAAGAGAAVWIIGAALIVVGVLAELVSGSRFRGFFDVRHGQNEKLGWKDDAWIKRVLARAGLALGVALLVVGLVFG